MRILGFSGSLRQGSYNTMLLQEAIARRTGRCRIRTLYNVDRVAALQRGPRSRRWTCCGAKTADGDERRGRPRSRTPEYNGSIPGHLKTAIDWASRPTGAGALAGKPTAVIGASTGSFGAIRAQDDLRRVLRVAGARVLPDGIAIADASRAFDDRGRLRRHGLHGHLQELLSTLIRECDRDCRLAA